MPPEKRISSTSRGSVNSNLVSQMNDKITRVHVFNNLEFPLLGARKRDVGVSRSSIALAKIIPTLQGLSVLDLGCGIGYMTVGALKLGARHVTAIDVEDVEGILMRNVELNGFAGSDVSFVRGDSFSSINESIKFGAIIANLPQHAMPATPQAKRLLGKYGGFDGTDLVCRYMSEAAFYLSQGGSYFGSISELTNFRRTFSLAEYLYDIRIKRTATKRLKKNEMLPYLTDAEIHNHLEKLMQMKLVRFSRNAPAGSVSYRVHYCEFILKN